MNVIFDRAGFVGVLRVNVDAAEIGLDTDVVAIVRGHRASQIRGKAVVRMGRVRINRLAAGRGARGGEQYGGEGRGEQSTEGLSKIAPRDSSRQVTSHRYLLRIFRAGQYREWPRHSAGECTCWDLSAFARAARLPCGHRNPSGPWQPYPAAH